MKIRKNMDDMIIFKVRKETHNYWFLSMIYTGEIYNWEYMTVIREM